MVDLDLLSCETIKTMKLQATYLETYSNKQYCLFRYTYLRKDGSNYLQTETSLDGNALTVKNCSQLSRPTKTKKRLLHAIFATPKKGHYFGMMRIA